MKIRFRLSPFKQHILEDADSLSGGGSAKDDKAPVVVRFSQSDLAVDWDDRFESLLDLAEHFDIPISAGCRYGDCSTCQTQLLVGEVSYNHATGVQPDAGYCLPCSCRPLTSITLAA